MVIGFRACLRHIGWRSGRMHMTYKGSASALVLSVAMPAMGVSRIRVLLLWLALLCVIWPAGPAHADAIVDAKITANVYDIVPGQAGSKWSYYRDYYEPDTVGVEVHTCGGNNIATGSGGNWTVDAKTEPGGGATGISVSTHATADQNDQADVSINASDYLVDTWTLDPKDHPGVSEVRINGQLNLKGSLTSSHTGTGNASARVLLFSTIWSFAPSPYADGTYGSTDSGCCVQVGKPYPWSTGTELTLNEPLITTIPISVLMPVNVPWAFALGMEMYDTAFADTFPDSFQGCPCSPGKASVDANFIDTLSWGGITSIIDPTTGQPITDYELTSASGFDYSKPFVEPAAVPEPSSAFLLLSAFGGLCAIRRHRRRRLRCARASYFPAQN